ncbi:MAG: hypothetical protein K9J37_13565 [Saprospiraceae bacterium]|nr:hypothetical protein [Saprospiraceae bacterium]MCF8250937.1 hypothetical protein [Saprospiraceae bacterium]MCF8281915.1 hypothetical protein [Bacteroidales bacterium]MCF8311902.1 hypothetical protein [Saprospiraceae bacterium]MCF8441910.1 hypothetical protein [Saprospiraceae bacterium]
MQSIKELLEVSGYEPMSGYSLELARMARAGLERGEALQLWAGLGRSEGSFYKAWKVLKDDLVRLAFLERKGSGLEGRRLEVWEKYKVVNQLLISGKKTAAVSMAIDLVAPAQKGGFTEIVVGLASLLEGHFGSIEVDSRRYLRYRKIRKDYSRMYDDELDVKSLQARLGFSTERKKDLKELEAEVLGLMEKKSGSFNFMRYRFSVLSVWFEKLGDVDGLVLAFRETVAAFEIGGVELTGAALSNLYFRLTPILALAERFGEAEAHVSRALKSTKPGTQNWHLFMLQRACIGHLSGKPGMVQGAVKLALDAPREHENPAIDRSWELVGRLLGGEEIGDVWKVLF